MIYPLGNGFSYDPDGTHYKGAGWIVKNIIDTAAKGGSFQVGVGPTPQAGSTPALYPN